MSQTNKENIWELIDFVTKDEITILYLMPESDSVPNTHLTTALKRLILNYNQESANREESKYNTLGSSDTSDILIPSDIKIASFRVRKFGFATALKQEEKALSNLLKYMGVGGSAQPNPGYYLFVMGRVVAFSNEKGVMDIEAKSFFKSIINKLKGNTETDSSAIQRAEPLAMNFFNYLVAFYEKEKNDTVQKLRRDIADKNQLMLATAFAFFGLDAKADLTELKKARKLLLAQNHPDTSPNNPAELKQKEEISRKINQTYEFIYSRISK
ncbi:MAG: hypothetical protein Kapaf2KO_08720 [Candidatus Kapaibacteriales bacterium]